MELPVKLLRKLWRSISLARRYKEILVSVLSQLDEEKADKAVEEVLGKAITGKPIKLRCREIIRKYLEMMKEDLGL